jgi:hypothetical protein
MKLRKYFSLVKINYALLVIIVVMLVILIISYRPINKQNIPGAPVGFLEGKFNIGPNCPVERNDTSCQTPAAVYKSKTLLVYDDKHQNIIREIIPEDNGTYSVSLPTGKYILEIARNSFFDVSSEFPKMISIEKGKSTFVNVTLDTGIR